MKKLLLKVLPLALVGCMACNKEELNKPAPVPALTQISTTDDRAILISIADKYKGNGNNQSTLRVPTWWVAVIADGGGAWTGAEIGSLLPGWGTAIGACIGGVAASAAYCYGGVMVPNDNDDDNKKDVYANNTSNAFDAVGRIHNSVLSEVMLNEDMFLSTNGIDTLELFNLIKNLTVQKANVVYNLTLTVDSINFLYDDFVFMIKNGINIAETSTTNSQNADARFIIDLYKTTSETITDKAIILEFTIAMETAIAKSIVFSQGTKDASLCFLTTSRNSYMFWF